MIRSSRKKMNSVQLILLMTLLSCSLIYASESTTSSDHETPTNQSKTFSPEPLLIENEPETETDTPIVEEVPKTSSPAVVTSSSPLQVDLYEFIDLIPTDEVNELRVRYYVSDPNVRKAYDFLRDYNYTFVHTQLYKMVEVKKAFWFFEQKGVDLKEVGVTLNERVGPPSNTPELMIEQGEPKNGGFYAMVDNILDVIPQDEVVTLFFEKMETSHDFAELVDWVGGNDFKEMLNVLRFNKEVQRFVYGLRNNGVDVIKVFKLLKGYFGFGFKK